MADIQAPTESDVQSLATKLVEFSKTLTPAERIVLMEQLGQGAADEDVQGFQQRYFSEKFADAHRAELLREAEQERLMEGMPSQRPNVVRLAVGKVGAFLVGVGTRLKQVELGRSERPATGPL